MKDALGHGSDKRSVAPQDRLNRSTTGNHQAGVLALYRVQQLQRLGWKTKNTIGGTSGGTIAENVAKYMRADNRNPGMLPSRVAGIKSTV